MSVFEKAKAIYNEFEKAGIVYQSLSRIVIPQCPPLP